MSGPRLLFLMNEALFFTTHRMPVALAAQAAGFEVHVAAPFAADPVEVIRGCGFHYHVMPLKRGGRSLWGEARLLARCFRLIRLIKPDLVHHVAMKPVIFGGLASRLMGVGAVVHAVTGLGFLFIRDDWLARIIRALIMPLYRFALGHPNARVIFQNPDDLKMFLDRGLVREETTVMIKGCGVDMTIFAPGETPGEPIVVMFPARILGDKGVHEFVQAARALKDAGSEARFVLVGRRDPSNPTDVAEATIRAWEAEDLVEWWGFHSDMPDVLRQAHIVCMPSYREGLPRGLIEAAACGLPIVTADVPGCREVVRQGESGLLVPVRDGPATAEAIGKLLADSGLRRSMGRAARQLALDEFTVEAFVADTMATYEAVLPRGEQP
ncbi:MAG: glycosyltransferase family 4 protein [Alphaproteobacteria bacterium]|nr:glycosyltransferase family 4 protein [Alphaproteobacteria bacterium]